MGTPGGVGGHWGASRGVGVSGVYWGLPGTVGTQGQKRYWGIREYWELLGGVGGVGAVMGVSGASEGVLGAGRDSRYSGARRGMGSTRGHWDC